MHAIPESKHPMPPTLGDCRRAPAACAPPPDTAPRTIVSEWRKILSGLVEK
jgi:hypothetical protein